MRRLDLAGLAVFPAPFPRLSRPVSDIICPARIILQDDGVAIPWCGLNRTAHAKDAYSDGVIRPFILHFAARRLYSTRGKAQSTPFGTASWRRGVTEGTLKIKCGPRKRIDQASRGTGCSSQESLTDPMPRSDRSGSPRSRLACASAPAARQGGLSKK